MFISCPHCRDLVALDRDTRLPPTICPRCGGPLQAEIPPGDAAPLPPEPTAAGPSIASLLRGDEAGAAADPTDPTATAGVSADADADADAELDIVALSDIAEMSEQPAAVLEPEVAPLAAHAAPGMLHESPRFTRQVARPPLHPRTMRWQWATLIVLSLLLAVQVLVADRTRLAADPGWRPLISRMCGVLGCSIPAWHQPGAFAMLSRDVRPIAGTPGALHVQATFRNDARWSQPWPMLLLSLSDADGRVVGARAFTPAEYLGAAAAQTELAPGQSARVALQLREPGPDVVAFTFDFR